MMRSVWFPTQPISDFWGSDKVARPTIVDVAYRAGVSKSAVSFALNGRPGVAGATRVRILAAAAELGWQPSTRARALSSSRAFALGMVLTRPPELLCSDPFFPAFIAGVETVLSARGHSVVLQVVEDGRAEADGYRRLAADGRVDGVFLADLRSNDPRIPLLRGLHVPAVTLNRPDVPSPYPAVCCDDRDGVLTAVQHLVSCGHTRIAHVSGPESYLHARHRQMAWSQALHGARLAPGPLRMGDFTAASGARITRELLLAPDPPTAIVFANDVMALAGMAVAAELGLNVPGDLSVIGFDDISLAAYQYPALTTVRADPFVWGQAAAGTLLSLVEDNGASDVTLAPAVFVPRQSSGPVPAGMPHPVVPH